MFDDSNPARSNNDDDDDVVRELLVTCDRAPAEGLAWIDRLDEDLRSKPMIMFARFIALRHLAINGFYRNGTAEFGSLSVDALTPVMDATHRGYAEQALAQVAALEACDPTYIPNLGDPDDRFGERMVDDVCIVVDRLRPGRVQQVLGWTKLHFFGSERLGELPGVFDDTDTQMIRAALRTRCRPPLIVRSAISYSKGEDGYGRRYVDAYLMEGNFKETPTVGDANMLGSVRIFDDGDVTWTALEPDPAAAPEHDQAPQGTRGETTLRAKPRSRWTRWLTGR
jgi:hypothetical protein